MVFLINLRNGLIRSTANQISKSNTSIFNNIDSFKPFKPAVSITQNMCVYDTLTALPVIYAPLKHIFII